MLHHTMPPKSVPKSSGRLHGGGGGGGGGTPLVDNLKLLPLNEVAQLLLSCKDNVRELLMHFHLLLARAWGIPLG